MNNPENIKPDTDNHSEKISPPEKGSLEKYKSEKANLMGAKSLLVFLRNTKSKGTEFQKKILADVFKNKDKKN